MASGMVRNVTFGQDECFTRDSHHTLIWTAVGRRRKIARSMGDIRADNREVPIIELPNIRTAPAANALRSVLMRVRPNTLDKSHASHLTIVRCPVKPVCRYFLVVTDKSQQAICSRVARILRQEREKRGLSMNSVAEKAGLSQQMVSYVEREMRNPTLETLLRIAAAMEVNLADVLAQALKEGRKVAARRKS